MKKPIRFFWILFLFIFFVPTYASDDDAHTWDEVRFGGITEQGLDNSCGLASLLTIMRTHFGDERYDESSLLKKYMKDASEESLAETMKNGFSLLEMEKLAKSLGYATSKKTLTFSELERLVSFVPVLVYLEVGRLRHFAVVRGIQKNIVLLGDPSRGNVEYSRDEFLSEWGKRKGVRAKTGAGLILVQTKGVPAKKLLKQPGVKASPSFTEMQRQLIK
ncbi:MAG: cysteine peptidase family C39 domain-containing protein [bacterium]|nr:cysteine peptidase family C39 domain-containing protein [bacterium]